MPLDQPEDPDLSQDPDSYRAKATESGQYPDDDSPDKTMPLGDHIEELRSRLVKMLIGVVIALVVTVIYSFQIVGWLAQPLLYVQDKNGVASPPIQTDPTAGFANVYMPVVLIAAVIVAAPWIIWQIWQFVVVGLYEHEKKAVHILAPFSTIMTGLAVAFTYYILLPVSLNFFMHFVTLYPEVDLTQDPPWVTRMALSTLDTDSGARLPEDFVYDTEPLRIPVLESRPENPENNMLWINGKLGRVEMFFDDKVSVLAQRSTKLITPLPAMNEYVRFAAIMMLGIVVAFQLPVVMLVLGWTKLFDPRGIASLRKYAIFASCALGAVLTPSDPFSMLVLAVPLYLLFEFGLLLMKLTFNRKEEALPNID